MEITYYTPNTEGNVAAYLGVRIPMWGMTINDCREIKTKKGGRFIALPSRRYEENGETKYYPIISFDTKIAERFQTSVKKAIEEHLKKQNQQQETADNDDGLPF